MIRNEIEKILMHAGHAAVPKTIDQILAITNPPVTVDLPCDKCGGSGSIKEICQDIGQCGDDCYNPSPRLVPCIGAPCTCENGKVKRGVVWTWEGDAPIPEPLHMRSDGMREHHCGFEDAESPRFTFKLTLHALDLLDPDVAWAYHALCLMEGKMEAPVPNGKGVLRLEAIDGE
jgi:hypothetical protein